MKLDIEENIITMWNLFCLTKFHIIFQKFPLVFGRLVPFIHPLAAAVSTETVDPKCFIKHFTVRLIDSFLHFQVDFKLLFDSISIDIVSNPDEAQEKRLAFCDFKFHALAITDR